MATPTAVRGLPFLKKATTQLASKARFVSAQLIALLTDDLWLRNAAHANAMALRLHDGLAGVPGVRIAHEVQANAVFAILPGELAAHLRTTYSFETWDAERGVIRLMTAFDTEESDVDAFVSAASGQPGRA